MIIALDLDGVIFDFDRGVKEILGLQYVSLNKSSSEMTKEEKQKKNYLYSKLAVRGNDFWPYLEFMPGAEELFQYVSENYKYGILTGYVTSGKQMCIDGKKAALKSKLNIIANEENFVCCASAEKKDYVTYFGTPTVLIDDRIRNVNEFREAGGYAILHTNVKQTIQELETLREKLYG